MRHRARILVALGVLSGAAFSAAPAHAETAVMPPAPAPAEVQPRCHPFPHGRNHHRAHDHRSPELAPAVRARIDAAVAAQVDALGLVGALIAVDQPGVGRYEQAFGLADARTGEAMTTAHRVGIASASKTFTAVALLRLVDQGRLSLDDPLDRYVHGVPNGERITIRQLMGMRSGIFELVRDEALRARWDADLLLPGWQARDVVSVLRRNEPAAEPGAETAYANVNYVLAGLVLEAVTGRPASASLEHLVLEPLQLHHTGLRTSPMRPTPSTKSYLRTRADGERYEVPSWNPDVLFTAGSVMSTVGDLARWSRALSDGALMSLPTACAQRQFTPLAATAPAGPSYGLGLMRIGDWLGHDGILFGETTIMLTNMRTGVTIVVATNTMDIAHEAAPAALLFNTVRRALAAHDQPS
jgi:D-alanyl-D-alanine carboxypeptidase